MQKLSFELSDEKLLRFDALCEKVGISRLDLVNESITLFARFVKALDDGHSYPLIKRTPNESAEWELIEIASPGLVDYEKKVRRDHI